MSREDEIHQRPEGKNRMNNETRGLGGVDDPILQLDHRSRHAEHRLKEAMRVLATVADQLDDYLRAGDLTVAEREAVFRQTVARIRSLLAAEGE